MNAPGPSRPVVVGISGASGSILARETVDGLLDRFGCFRHDTRAAGGERAPRVEI